MTFIFAFTDLMTCAWQQTCRSQATTGQHQSLCSPGSTWQ